ncbi:MAG: hypothetical protein ACXQS9_01445 [Methermicoccaceae archaeon]
MTRTLLDIAPTIGTLAGVPLRDVQGNQIPSVLEHFSASTEFPIILVIADSLCSNVYDHPQLELPTIRAMGTNCIIEKLHAVSNKTTPAIASILCGVYPEVHGVHITNDVKTPNRKSVLELASEMGIVCGMATESEGAAAFRHRIDFTVGVDDSEDIAKYDEKILRGTLALVRRGCDIVCTHFRSIDRAAHRAAGVADLVDACTFVDGLVGRLARLHATMFLCGDHIVHTKWQLGTQTTIPFIGCATPIEGSPLR